MSKEMYFFLIICGSFLIFNPALCEDEDANVFDTDTGHTKDRIDPHSFYYDRMSKKMLKNDDEESSFSTPEPTKKIVESVSTENQSMHEKIFYKRLVNILLTNMHIQESDEDFITGVLHIKASHSQIKILESFHEAESSLREIDAILSEVIIRPRISYTARTIDFLKTVGYGIQSIVEILVAYRETTMIGLAVVACLVMLKTAKWRARFPIFILIQVIFVVSFFMTWWQLIREAEIELTAQQMQFSQLPLACQPHKMNVWHKFMSLFNGDDCKKYYEAMMTNPKLRVTPATALSHLVSNMMVHPAVNIGRAVSAFISSATDELPCLYAWIVKIVLFTCVGIVLVMLPIVLFGANFTFGLGPLFRLGLDSRRGERSPKSIQKREPVEIIIKVADKSAEAIAAVPETKERKDTMKQLTYEVCKRDSSSEEEATEDVEEVKERIETLKEQKRSQKSKKAKAAENSEEPKKKEKCESVQSSGKMDKSDKDEKNEKESPKKELGGGDN